MVSTSLSSAGIDLRYFDFRLLEAWVVIADVKSLRVASASSRKSVSSVVFNINYTFSFPLYVYQKLGYQ